MLKNILGVIMFGVGMTIQKTNRRAETDFVQSAPGLLPRSLVCDARVEISTRDTMSLAGVKQEMDVDLLKFKAFHDMCHITK